MAIDRYYTAFERGTMSDADCAQRVNKLKTQQLELRARELEIGATLDAASVTAPDDGTLAEMRSHITLAIRNGAPLPLKGLLKALVAGITVDDRYAIHPVFRVPAGSDLSPQVSGVRIQSGYVDPTEQNTNPNPLVEGPTIRLAGVHAKIRREGYRKRW